MVGRDRFELSTIRLKAELTAHAKRDILPQFHENLHVERYPIVVGLLLYIVRRIFNFSFQKALFTIFT